MAKAVTAAILGFEGVEVAVVVCPVKVDEKAVDLAKEVDTERVAILPGGVEGLAKLEETPV